MQSIYATLKTEDERIVKQEQFLFERFNHFKNLTALLFQLLAELQLVEKNTLEANQKKILSTPQDLNPNLKLAENRILKTIATSPSLINFFKTEENIWKSNDYVVKNVWESLKKSNLSQNYLDSNESSFEEDKKFIYKVYRKIIAPNTKLFEFIEATFMGWVDDFPIVNSQICKVLHELSETDTLIINNPFKNKDDENFAKKLFRVSLASHMSYEDYIVTAIPNWDKDRVATLDMILIKMAVCEFLEFPQVPEKVTINEYIEIAKEYSTLKSGTFINGVLHNLWDKYNELGRIKKIGRGLQ